MMEARKEEVQYIKDTPIRIIMDSEVSVLRGKLPPHWHDEIEINYVLKGSVYYIVNGITYSVSRDEVVVIDSSVIHSGRCGDGNTVEETHAEILTLQINKDVFRYASYDIPSFQVFLTRAESAELRSIMSEIKSIYEQKDRYYEMLLNSQILKLCYCLLSRHSADSGSPAIPGKTNKEIKQVLRYIEDHCTEKVKLEDAADLINYNPSYFSRLFHQFTGFTFVEYLNRCRTDAAVRMLQETDRTISEIAMECGFPNVSSFITFFKRQYQMTPEKYRKNYAGRTV